MVESLKIIHAVASIDHGAAGISHSVMGMAAAQRRLGCAVSIHALDYAISGQNLAVDVVRHKRDFATVPMLRQLGLSCAMRAALAVTDATVIHSRGLWMFPAQYRWRGGQTLGRLRVVSPHGMLSSVALSYSRVPKMLFSAIAQNAALRDAGMFHATSNQEVEDIRAYGLRQPIALVPHGVDLPPSEALPAKGKRRTVLSLGRVHPKKGLDILIAAWAKVEADFPAWDLLIVGPDEKGHLAELQELTSRLGLSRVTFGAPLFGAEKTATMARSEIFALPTRSENFAMTVAESLAAGTPVISSKGAPWGDLVTYRCGWWIDPDVESFAATLRDSMALPPTELIAMGLRGRNWMKSDFSWDTVATRMLEAYKWGLSMGDRPASIVAD